MLASLDVNAKNGDVWQILGALFRSIEKQMLSVYGSGVRLTGPNSRTTGNRHEDRRALPVWRARLRGGG
jgi:hypothetical protein